MITLKEVAKRAEVSTATVSKVLSNTPYVSEETRNRVLQAIDELGYVPNLAARALSKGRTYIIGVIFPYNYDHLFGDPFMLTVLEGVERVCTERGYNMLLSTPRVPVLESTQYRRLIQSGYLDGVITLENVADTPASTLPEQYGYPWVAIGTHSARGSQNTIQADDFGGAKCAAAWLLAAGHRHIGVITVADAALASAQRRMGGYRAAFAEYGLNLDAMPIVLGNFSAESGYRAADQLLRHCPRPTAILCLNDRMAMGAIQRLHAERLHVPEEVSVIGFDDIPGAEFFDPPLTTVRQPAQAMGAQAARQLFDLIEAGRADPKRARPASFEALLFPTELIVRASAAARI